jgi:ribonuclease T2
MGRSFKVWVVAVALLGAAPLASARHHHRNSDTTAGEFDFYLLSLSWSPAFCLQQPDSAECSGPRKFGFIVHGLWPQNERGWPSNCGGTSDVPDAVVEGISDLMPAKKLIYHEWSTHGTCSGLEPEAYFGLVRRARTSINIPSEFTSPGAAIQQAPASIVGAFLHANPRLPADSVVATCSRQGAPRLREVHVCFDRNLQARACSADALKEGCRADSVIVAPIR